MVNAETSDVHLVIIGGGSAAFSGAHQALDLGARVTICNKGLPIGGTCLNVGCVPSKALIRAAETYHRSRHTGFHGLQLQAELLDFGALIQQKRDLVEGLRRSNYEEMVPKHPRLRYIPDAARLAGPGRVVAGTEGIAADRILLATGTRPFVPPVPGLAETGYLTNEDVFELDALPESMLVLGGGYIALECAQMFHRFGTRVTVLQRSSHVLSDQPAYLAHALTGYLSSEGLNIVCGTTLQRVFREDGHVRISATVDGEATEFSAACVVVATGRTPNTENIGLVEHGIALTPKGYVKVDEYLRTSVEGVFAAGDVIGPPEFVYTASYEAELAIRNALTESLKGSDYSALPWVIFTDPQVAGVGMDEDEAAAAGYDAEGATLPSTRWPRLKVAQDMRGFLKLIRDRRTDHLLGARILAPEGGDLVTEIALAIRHGITARDLAESFHPYLTLSEGIQRAAQRFTYDKS